jgi:glucans biosynthesis protein
LVVVALTTLVAVASWPSRAGAQPLFVHNGPFDANTVVELAQSLAKVPYVPPRTTLPEPIDNLSFDQYRDIRFRPSATIWAEPPHRFRLQLLPLGFLFKSPVEIALVDHGRAEHLRYRADLFTTGKVAPTLPSDDIGFSGFRLLYPINDARHFNEAAVFQGASYFRSLGRDQGFGLSARGLALRTGDSGGEEFPIFRAFWIETPARGSSRLVVHALLDSPSVAGAYRFEIEPGNDTGMLVQALLFPRVDLDQIGVAPETSMFMFSQNGRRNVDDFRPQVHDSDGLLMMNGHGEQIWRPLANPAKLQISVFGDHGPRGFGLMQRERNAADYQDFESNFERRPNLWVEPVGDWGPGAVILVEIPSDAEIHDNIVAFWRPRAVILRGTQFRTSYRLIWGGGEPKAAVSRVRVVATAHGRADAQAPTPQRRFVIDYSPTPEPHGRRSEPPHATVTATAGKIKHVVVSENPLTHGDRVTFVLDPNGAELSELRVDLKYDDGRTAEVWLYRWTKS